MLSSLVLSLAARAPGLARHAVTVAGWLAARSASQRREPHWLLRDLIRETQARIPVGATMAHGMEVMVPLSDYVQQDLAATGDYEPDTRTVLERELKPGMTMIDAGAHVGVFSLIGARAVGAGGVVHSFEPDPAIARLLQRNVRRNAPGNVVVNAVALGDRAGTATFHIASDAGVNSFQPAKKSLYRSHAITVPVVSLAEYLRDHRVAHVDLIKVDVEGAELMVLRSVDALLSRVDAPTIIAEVAPERQRAFGSSASEFIRWLRDHKYQLYRIGGPSPTLMAGPVDEDEKAIYNVLAVPSSRSRPAL